MPPGPQDVAHLHCTRREPRIRPCYAFRAAIRRAGSVMRLRIGAMQRSPEAAVGGSETLRNLFKIAEFLGVDVLQGLGDGLDLEPAIQEPFPLHSRQCHDLLPAVATVLLD